MWAASIPALSESQRQGGRACGWLTDNSGLHAYYWERDYLRSLPGQFNQDEETTGLGFRRDTKVRVESFR